MSASLNNIVPPPTAPDDKTFVKHIVRKEQARGTGVLAGAGTSFLNMPERVAEVIMTLVNGSRFPRENLE